MHDFAYRRPSSLAEAASLIASDDSASLLSGGQTLLPVLRARLAAPSQLVDLARLPELKGISSGDGRIRIGAAELHADVAATRIVRQAIPALAALAGGIGDPQVRHRGTIGGSVANNDPAACYPSACLALDATIHTNRHDIPADEFFVSIFTTALEHGEIVTAVSFPVCRRAHYEKHRNPASRFALIGVFVADFGHDVRVAITGAGTGVFRWSEAEKHLSAGGDPAALADLPLDADRFTGDLFGSAEYRMQIARVMTRRSVAALPAA